MSLRLIFVESAPDAPLPARDVRIIVLDTAWTPGPDDRPDLIPLRGAVSAVLAREDFFAESLARLDAWADAGRIPDRMTVDGASWWFPQRPFLSDFLHEQLLWCRVITELEGGTQASQLQVPEGEHALVDVAHRFAAARAGTVVTVVPQATGQAANPPAAPASPRRGPGVVDRLTTWRARRRQARREAILARRVSRSGEVAHRILVIAQPRIYQALSSDRGDRRADPQMAAVIDRLAAAGRAPFIVGLGLDHRVNDHWAQVADDDNLIPESLLETRWGDRLDSRLPPSGAQELLDGVRDASLDVDGIDLGPLVHARTLHLAGRPLEAQRRRLRRATRMLSELRPAALFLNHEGIRTTWLAAAQQAGIPSFAVQHGLIYPRHSVYSHARHPSLLLPTLTFTFGPYERDILLEHGGYTANEVVVSGSPRLDLDGGAELDADARVRERASVRRELGVREEDRLLVVSTAHTPLFRRFHLADMIGRLLGGPLPGVHVVFKLHPGEQDLGPYRELLAGLGAAGGYSLPGISVVRDIDLYRLLRAADAHLGLHSTVLTDAVAAGTPNLLAAGQKFGDLLGYVAAGVATPVRNHAELAAAMASPRAASPGDRAAFLARHFLLGDASGRIVAAISAIAGS